MKGMAKYTVTCKNCTRSDLIGLINDQTIIWDGTKHIISGRKRLDGEWGWECGSCGNNSLMTEQEKKDIKNLQDPDPKDIAKVIANLKAEKDTKFSMHQL